MNKPLARLIKKMREKHKLTSDMKKETAQMTKTLLKKKKIRRPTVLGFKM